MAGELYIGIDVSKDSLEVAFGATGQCGVHGGLCAARCNPLLAPFIKACSAAAQPEAALVAVIRRLLGILDAIVHDRTPWSLSCAVPV